MGHVKVDVVFVGSASSTFLASGDEDGRVVVWSVGTGSAVAALDDAGAAFGGKRGTEGGRGGVVGLGWASATPGVLAVLLAPCALLLWDYRSE